MRLISMTDFVLDQTELLYEKNQSKLIHNIVNYAQFLKQPLKLEMFVPCDDKGNVLSDPGLIPSYELEQYRKAKEKVLFEGFESCKECDEYLCLTHEHITIYYNIEDELFILDDNTVLSNIECLCNDFNYTYRYTTLTQNAIKQFN